MDLQTTSERLRSKHVRTLELLQKTLDENVDLRDQLTMLKKGKLHLAQLDNGSGSNRIEDLEDEINRLRLQHATQISQLHAQWETQQTTMTNQLALLQSQLVASEKQNQENEAAQKLLRDALRQERIDMTKEKQRLLHENDALGRQVSDLASQQTHWHQSQQEALQNTSKVQELQHQLDVLQQANEQYQIAYQTMSRDLESANATIIHLQQQQQQEQNQLQLQQVQQNDALRDQEVTHHKQMASLNTELDDFHVQLETIQQELQIKKELTATLQARNAQQQDRIKQLTIELAQTQEKLQQTTSAPALGTSALRDGRASMGNSRLSFGAHIDLKRENYQLRAQIEEMKQLQKRFLGTAKKKTIQFPSL